MDSDIVLLPSRMIKVRILIDFNFYRESGAFHNDKDSWWCTVLCAGEWTQISWSDLFVSDFIQIYFSDVNRYDSHRFNKDVLKNQNLSVLLTHTHNKHTTRQKPCQDCLNY